MCRFLHISVWIDRAWCWYLLICPQEKYLGVVLDCLCLAGLLGISWAVYTVVQKTCPCEFSTKTKKNNKKKLVEQKTCPREFSMSLDGLRSDAWIFEPVPSKQSEFKYKREVHKKILAHPEFGSSVNPITTRGADYAHHITASPLGFENPAASLSYKYLMTLVMDGLYI